MQLSKYMNYLAEREKMNLNELVNIMRTTEDLDALINTAELNNEDYVLVDTSKLRFLIDFILEANYGITLSSMIDCKWEKDILLKSTQLVIKDVLMEKNDVEM